MPEFSYEFILWCASIWIVLKVLDFLWQVLVSSISFLLDFFFTKNYSQEYERSSRRPNCYYKDRR